MLHDWEWTRADKWSCKVSAESIKPRKPYAPTLSVVSYNYEVPKMMARNGAFLVVTTDVHGILSTDIASALKSSFFDHLPAHCSTRRQHVRAGMKCVQKLIGWCGSGEAIRCESGILYLERWFGSGSSNGANFLNTALDETKLQVLCVTLTCKKFLRQLANGKFINFRDGCGIFWSTGSFSVWTSWTSSPSLKSLRSYLETYTNQRK